MKHGLTSARCFKCSRKKKGDPNPSGFKKGMVPWNKGIPMTDETRIKVSEARRGKMCGTKNHKWKGNKASYAAKHIWIFTNYGKATKCEQCGATNRMIHWANISDQYKRKRSDWKQLCVPCHSKFDKNKKVSKA